MTRRKAVLTALAILLGLFGACAAFIKLYGPGAGAWIMYLGILFLGAISIIVPVAIPAIVIVFMIRAFGAKQKRPSGDAEQSQEARDLTLFQSPMDSLDPVRTEKRTVEEGAPRSPVRIAQKRVIATGAQHSLAEEDAIEEPTSDAEAEDAREKRVVR
jgi:hypothetical protein